MAIAQHWGGGGPFGTKCAGARRILPHFRQMWFRLWTDSRRLPRLSGVGLLVHIGILAEHRASDKV